MPLVMCTHCASRLQLEVLDAEHQRLAQDLEAKKGEMASRRYLKVTQQFAEQCKCATISAALLWEAMLHYCSEHKGAVFAYTCCRRGNLVCVLTGTAQKLCKSQEFVLKRQRSGRGHLQKHTNAFARFILTGARYACVVPHAGGGAVSAGSWCAPVQPLGSGVRGSRQCRRGRAKVPEACISTSEQCAAWWGAMSFCCGDMLLKERHH